MYASGGVMIQGNTFFKTPGPPFVPTSANNGLSVDAITGKIVLGNNVGGVSATLLSNREIPCAGFTVDLFGGGLILSDTSNAGTGARLDLLQTVSGASSISTLSIQTTFNTTGTPTAIFLNVTKTAANAAANIIDLQQGGISRLIIPVDGARMRFNSSGFMLQSMSGTVGGISFNGSAPVGNAIITSAGFQMVNADTVTGVALDIMIISGGTGLSIRPTSGTMGLVVTGGDFEPTSGTAVAALHRIAGVINQTGGANGITRGLYVNPTLTAAADFRAIETTTGKTYLGGTIRASDGTLPNGPGDWLLGTVVAAASVLDATAYVEVRIGGVTVKLAKIT